MSEEERRLSMNALEEGQGVNQWVVQVEAVVAKLHCRTGKKEPLAQAKLSAFQGETAFFFFFE